MSPSDKKSLYKVSDSQVTVKACGSFVFQFLVISKIQPGKVQLGFDFFTDIVIFSIIIYGNVFQRFLRIQEFKNQGARSRRDIIFEV